MTDYNSEFREFLKEIHAYYSRERNLRSVKGLTFKRVQEAAKPLIEYAKNHKELLQDILDNPSKYPFHLFGVKIRSGAEISAPDLGITVFSISFFRDSHYPSGKKANQLIITSNPG